MWNSARLLSPFKVDLELSRVSLAALGLPQLAPEATAAARTLKSFFEANIDMLGMGEDLPEEIPIDARSALQETIANIQPAEYAFCCTDKPLLERLAQLMAVVEEHQGLLPEAQAESLVQALEKLAQSHQER